MNFSAKLDESWRSSGGALCVGLDPIISRMPSAIASGPRPILTFNKHVIDIVGDMVCAFKPQIAHHAAERAEGDLEDTIAYIRDRWPKAVIILDAKRGDIGSTAEMYAREAFERYDADAVTVNPFMGDDSILPFLQRPDRAAVVLCRTSNPDAGRFQQAMIDGEAVFAAIARRAEQSWNALGNVMLVVGATAVDDLAQVRRVAPSIPFLVPGVGEQGGSAEAVIAVGRRAAGDGLVISASRSILYAGDEQAIRAAAASAHSATKGRTPCKPAAHPSTVGGKTW